MTKSAVSVMLILSVIVFLDACKSSVKNTRKENNDKHEVFPVLTDETAAGFAGLALKCSQQEYPNKLSHVMNDSSEVLPPKVLHPVFFGCFDWHSCVHGHWLMVRLLKTFPELPEAEHIRKVLNDHFTPEKIGREVAYLQQANRKSFERTYGWAWMLKLSEELDTWKDPQGRIWARNLQPLTQTFVQRYLDFLPKQTYPIRRGVHANTAFGLIFALDYARESGNKALEAMIIKRSKDYFLQDKYIPARWEPGGDDFLSPSLQEAALMLRVLSPKDFVTWFHDFLPDLAEGKPVNLLTPPDVSDRSDPKIVHLDGLNLSRAWCMLEIARALPQEDARVDVLRHAAIKHARATLPFIASGHYEGEHWLASFAVYMFAVAEKGK